MVISDLNHLEVVTEEKNILGGGRFRRIPVAKAESVATADAIGSRYTESYTFTSAQSVAGLFSSSASASFAESRGN
ncbi:MAG: hypothetical protein KME06_03075 [Kastovskya adunca ATA6-11-RM4]|jgi:hypothetical protein|nr:hypothetical protein [Kastovskya adunca ATA6-11-RM4]